MKIAELIQSIAIAQKDVIKVPQAYINTDPQRRNDELADIKLHPSVHVLHCDECIKETVVLF